MTSSDFIKLLCPDCGFSAQVDSKKIPTEKKVATCPKCTCRFPIIRQPINSNMLTCSNCSLQQPSATNCRRCKAPLGKQKTAARSTSPPPLRRQQQPRIVEKTGVTLSLRSVLLVAAVVLVLLVGGLSFYWLGGELSPPSPEPTPQAVEAGRVATTENEQQEQVAASPSQQVDLIRSVASGDRHTAVVRSDGTLWLWGNNEFAQLGSGSLDGGTPVPTLLAATQGYKEVAAGSKHTLAIKNNGTVWGWGGNGSGQVGSDNAVEYVLRPEQVVGLTGVTALAAGDKHSLALKDDGTVWAWGDDLNGQLGTSASDQLSRRPLQVRFVNDVVSIAAGSSHSLALKSSGSVYIWGGVFPSLPGKNNNVKRTSPISIQGLPKIIAIAGGEVASIALDAAGTVWSLEGKLSFTAQEKKSMTSEEMRTAALKITPKKIDGLNAVTDIAAGDNHFLAMKNDGTVWGWGSNRRGELAAFNIKFSEKPIPIIRYKQNIASKINPNETMPLDDIKTLAAGGTTAFALDNSGDLWTWGDNYFGQRGVQAGVKYLFPWPVNAQSGLMEPNSVVVQTPPEETRYSPDELAAQHPTHKSIAGGYRHTLYINKDKKIVGWGENNEAQVSQRNYAIGSVLKKPTLVKLDEAGSIIEVAANRYHSLALGEDGSVWLWGSNPYQKSEKQFPRKIAENIQKIAAGRNFYLALDHDGAVYTFGGNYSGTVQRGKGIQEIYSPSKMLFPNIITQISVGASHGLALDVDGTVYSWGDNKFGQLGTDSKIGRQEPTPVAGIDDVVEIAAGGAISLALKQDGTVWAWGEGVASDFKGSRLNSSLKPVQVADLDNVVAIACGGLISEGAGHNLALKGDGTVWAWGNNQFAQLGDGTSENTRTSPVQVFELNGVIAIAAGDMHSLALKADGTMVAWGSNWGYQVGSGHAIATIPFVIEGL